MERKYTDNEILNYLEQWVNPEMFCELGYLIRQGHFNEALDTVINYGVINPEICYPMYKNIESEINMLHDNIKCNYDKAFKDSIVIECKNCNNVQVMEKENYDLYEKELNDRCWECGKNSDNLLIETYKGGK